MSVLRKQLKFLIQLGFYGLGFLGNRSKIPVLMYHSIDDTGSTISISPQMFRKHLQYLKNQGFESVSLQEYFNTPPSETTNKILITFDDGYQNLLSHALPILKEFSYQGVVFLVTDCVGKYPEWLIRDQKIILDKIVNQWTLSEKDKAAELQKLDNISKFKLLSWDEILEMKKEGIEFQSHSHTHPFVSEISIDEARFELEQSKSTMEFNLNQTVDAFCYPYTDYHNPDIIGLLQSLKYRGAFIGDQLTDEKKKRADYLIPRIPLFEESSLFDLAFSLSPGYRWYKACLQAARRYKNGAQSSPSY